MDSRTTGASRTGIALGTPTYMAPEQARDAKSVDPRADVYSFAATIYSALGVRPRCEIASAMGIELDPDGLIVTDDRQRTSIPGVYACGDIVHDALNQIAVGAAHAATAATVIHNALPPGWVGRT